MSFLCEHLFLDDVKIRDLIHPGTERRIIDDRRPALLVFVFLEHAGSREDDRLSFGADLIRDRYGFFPPRIHSAELCLSYIQRCLPRKKACSMGAG